MALILTRKNKQSLTMTTSAGETIKIVAHDIHNGKVCLSIEAPQSVVIVRDEARVRDREAKS